MQTLFLIAVLFCSLSVWAQYERISDPGFLSIAMNQCAPNAVWHFRSDYLWNSTETNTDAQCALELELPTAATSGVTKGNETDINKLIVPPLPIVDGTMDANYPSSAAVVDFNTPCRAALWAPFTVVNDTATLSLSFELWSSALSDINVQYLLDDSDVTNATLLQYLRSPEGLLQIDINSFPVIEEVTNQIRVDIIKPDGSGSFYDRAFSLDPEHIAYHFDLPNFGSESAIPVEGTNKAWVPVDGVTVLPTHGNYALRFSSAHSVIGNAWGVSNVHLIESGGTTPANNTVIPLEWDMVIDNAAQTVGGTLTVSKMVLIARKQAH